MVKYNLFNQLVKVKYMLRTYKENFLVVLHCYFELKKYINFQQGVYPIYEQNKSKTLLINSGQCFVRQDRMQIVSKFL